MFDAPAHLQRACEHWMGEIGLVVGEVRLAPDLRGVCLAPRVPTIGMRREVERLAGGLIAFGG